MKTFQTILFLVCIFFISGNLFSQNRLGINLRSCNDWETHHILTDVMKTSRSWTRPDFSSVTVTMDNSGYPTEDAECYVFHNHYMNGTYRLSFKGRSVNSGGSINAQFLHTSVTVGTWNYDPDTDRSSVSFSIADSGTIVFGIRFTGTSGGIRDVKIMRPLFPGSTESYPENSFITNQFKDAVQPFGVIRYMQFTGGMGNPSEYTWADRVPVSACSFNRDFPLSSEGYEQGGFNGRGASWEAVIRIANELNKDAWISIPARVDDDYIRQLARLFLYGSDENGNPYTAVQVNPVNPPLNPALNLYVEYGNELWNGFFGGEYDAEWNWEQANSTEEMAQYQYDFDGNENYWYHGFRRTARRAADASMIFREVFGDERMHTGSEGRIRPVLAWQFTAIYTGAAGLDYIENFYNDYLGVSYPLSYYFYAGGGAPYYKPANDANIDNVWESEDMYPEEWGTFIKSDAEICALYGLNYAAYEGGPDLSLLSNGETIGEYINSDPRMGEEVLEHHMVWNENGGGLFVYYALAQDYKFGFAEDIFNLNTPKLNAIKTLAESGINPVTVGRPVNTEIFGNDYDYFNESIGTEWMGNTLRMEQGFETGYVINVPSDGNYSLELKGYTNAESATLKVRVDGEVKAEFEMTPSSEVLTPINLALKAGLHGVRVRASLNGSESSRLFFESLVLKSSQTGTENGVSEISFCLKQNYPNPFNPSTIIEYSIPANINPAGVSLIIYDLLGREIAVPVNEEIQTGNHKVVFNAAGLPGGVYFCKLKAGGFSSVRKLLLVK